MFVQLYPLSEVEGKALRFIKIPINAFSSLVAQDGAVVITSRQIRFRSYALYEKRRILGGKYGCFFNKGNNVLYQQYDKPSSHC